MTLPDTPTRIVAYEVESRVVRADHVVDEHRVPLVEQ